MVPLGENAESTYIYEEDLDVLQEEVKQNGLEEQTVNSK